MQLADETIERRLGAVVARAGIPHDAAVALQARITGRHIVNQRSLLPDFGKQSPAHPAAQILHRHPHDVITLIRLRHRWIGDPDMRLLALLVLVMEIPRSRHLPDRFGWSALPI